MQIYLRRCLVAHRQCCLIKDYNRIHSTAVDPVVFDGKLVFKLNARSEATSVLIKLYREMVVLIIEMFEKSSLLRYVKAGFTTN